MTEGEVAYIAGILDGEGAISVRFRSGPNIQGSGRYLHFRVEIAQVDHRLIAWLQPRIGGKAYLSAPSKVWHLSLAKEPGAALLRLVRPYLIVKGEQADAYLQLAERDYRFGRRITDAELSERQRLVGALEASRGRA